jgi:hypothetical protein
VIFIVTDEALARYEQTHTTPPIIKSDSWNDSPRHLRWDTGEPWILPAWAESLVLYDRTGETTTG